MTSISDRNPGILQESICPLLALPGELRNRIYDYCIESGPIALPPAVHQHAPSRPYFGGLRYASRTLYIEFTPLYLERTVVSLHPSDVERYLAAIYTKQQTLSNGDNPVRGLGHNVSGHIRINLRLSEVLDLTPFAGLLSRAPNMRIEFARASAISSVIGEITEFLGQITDASCLIDFENTVERILFRYSSRSEVVVKLHHEVRLRDLFDDDIRQNPRHWLIQQGLPVLNHLKIVMESSEGVLRDPPSGADQPETLWSAQTKRGQRRNRIITWNGVKLRSSSLQRNGLQL